MALIEQSGGIRGFVDFMQNRAKIINSPRAALMLSYFIGVVIFIESSITSLIAGAVGRPFCDKYEIPQAKLAFVCDSTSAPVSSIIVLNGWGALLLGLITTQITQESLQVSAIDLLIDSVLYNFYAMTALGVTFLAVWFNIDLGPMKRATYQAPTMKMPFRQNASMWYMLLPILLMIVLVFAYLYITGDGNMLKGSGSSSIFYTVITTLVLMLFYYVPTKNMS